MRWRVVPLGRSLLLQGTTTGVLEASGRFHALEGWAGSIGGERAILSGEVGLVVAPRARLSESPGRTRRALEPSGERLHAPPTIESSSSARTT
ncbi:MAG: hypothetical protein R3B99_32505 [Polyangiales bacterium]